MKLTVFSALLAAALHVLLDPSQARQQQCGASADQMAAVELGRDLHRQRHATIRFEDMQCEPARQEPDDVLEDGLEGLARLFVL